MQRATKNQENRLITKAYHGIQKHLTLPAEQGLEHRMERAHA